MILCKIKHSFYDMHRRVYIGVVYGLGVELSPQRGRWKRGTGKRGSSKNAGVENVGLKNAAPDCRGGKRGTGKCRSVKSMESEDFKNVSLTVLTERIVWKQTRTLLLHKGGLSRDDFLGVLKVNLSNYWWFVLKFLGNKHIYIEHTSLIVLDIITCLDYVGL